MRPRKTGAMIGRVQELARFRTLYGFDGTGRKLYLSVDGSVWEPMKGVPSCDKPRVGAWSL